MTDRLDLRNQILRAFLLTVGRRGRSALASEAKMITAHFEELKWCPSEAELRDELARMREERLVVPALRSSPFSPEWELTKRGVEEAAFAFPEAYEAEVAFLRTLFGGG